MISNTYLKIAGLILIVLVALSMISVPASLVLADEEQEREGEDENITVRFNLAISFSEALDLAYTVRNVSYPMFEWGQAQNITLANMLLKHGDYLLEKAINMSSTNETKATILALAAAAIYSRAPIVAYPVLGKTIRSNLGENHTLTNNTVLAVIGKAKEIKDLVSEAKNISEQFNVTPLRIVDFIVADATGKINTSLQLLEMNYTGRALSYAVRAYHEYIRAYAWVIKSVFIEKLNLGETQRITEKIIVRKVDRKVMEKLIEHMPGWIKLKIMEKLRKGMIKDIEDLRKHIRLMVETYKERLNNMTANYITKTVVLVIITGSTLPGPQGQAIREWRFKHRLNNMWSLYSYIRTIVKNVQNETNATGIDLLKQVLNQLEINIENDTGVHVNLTQILNMVITIHTMHHRHH